MSLQVTHRLGIKIVEKPLIEVIGSQQFIPPDSIAWEPTEWDTNSPIDELSGGEYLAEFAGRLCYMSFGADLDVGGHKTVNGRGGGNQAYLDNIRLQRHGSVLEHAVYTILVQGVSRSFSHEMVRHRAGFGFSQLSQRFVDESDICFIRPPDIAAYSLAELAWARGCFSSIHAYGAIVEEMSNYLDVKRDKKRIRQAARSVLPNCAETKMVITGNGRAWRNFLEQRGSWHADEEIRAVALAVYKNLNEVAPNLVSDYRLVATPDLRPVGQMLETSYTKV